MERLELALEASNEGIWDWDFDTETIDFSPKVGEFFGCDCSEVANFFTDATLVHEDDREKLQSEIRMLKQRTKELLAAEPRIQTQDGEWKWFRIRAVPVIRDGRLSGMAGSMIDITERKWAEQQVLEQQHLTETLMESVPLQIYFKDLDSRFILVNTPLAKWLKLPGPEAMLGRTDADFFEEEHWKQALADERRILETGEAMEAVVEKETYSGREDAWVLTTKLPYRDQNGKLQGTFGVSSDVTELVRTQRSLAEMAAELKQRNEAYEAEMRLAREIQQGLVPKAYPSVRNAEFGHRYLPISGLAGDFFEILDLGNDAVALLICDVMGHGVRSALVASLLRGLVAQAMDSARKPSQFLALLNANLHEFLQKAGVTMFSTAFYVVIDYAEGKITYASAGHPAAIAVGSDGVGLLPLGGRGKGPGLGLFGEAEYGEEKIALDAVEELLLFTDGIFEVENSSGEAFLQNRLVQTVKTWRGKPMEELLDGVLEQVRGFAADNEFDDDVCLLAMKI